MVAPESNNTQNDDSWLNYLIFGVGTGMTAWGSSHMSGPTVVTQGSSSRPGIPVDVGLPAWLLPVALVFAAIWLFKKKH